MFLPQGKAGQPALRLAVLPGLWGKNTYVIRFPETAQPGDSTICTGSAAQRDMLLLQIKCRPPPGPAEMAGMVVESSITLPLTRHRSESPRLMPPIFADGRSVLLRMTFPTMEWPPAPRASDMTTVP